MENADGSSACHSLLTDLPSSLCCASAKAYENCGPSPAVVNTGMPRPTCAEAERGAEADTSGGERRAIPSVLLDVASQYTTGDAGEPTDRHTLRNSVCR